MDERKLVVLISLRDMPVRERATTVQEVLREPILRLLTEHGPLTLGALVYFLDRGADIEISENSLRMALRTLEVQTLVQQFQLDEAGNYARVFCIPGDQDREPGVPAQYNYEHAYIELHLRLMAIKANPELLNAPTKMIDDLFNPRVKP